MTEKEIRRAVKDRYPVTDTERGCRSEKEKLNELRKIYKQRLQDENMVREVLRGEGAGET